MEGRRGPSSGSAPAIAGLLAGGLTTLAYPFVVRPWHLRWGATRAESRARLPGDGIVPRPQLQFTRVVPIAATPAEVWPWLVQMGGYTRGGWYSVDTIDNAGRPSADEILPSLQGLAVGDVLPTSPDGSGFTVEALDPERSLILAIRAPAGTLSIAVVLRPAGDGVTRLVVRGRLRARPTLPGLWLYVMMDVGDFVMMRQMLRGIRRRAEQRHREAAVQGRPAEPARRRADPPRTGVRRLPATAAARTRV